MTQQMTHLVYSQTQMTFQGDVRNVSVFLQQQKDWLERAAANIANDDTLVIAIELDVVEEVQSIARDHQTLLDVREVVVANTQGQIMSRGYESLDRLDDSILGKSFGVMEDAGQYQMFSYAPMQSEGERIGHVIVWYALSDNHVFFQKLREALGKDALVFAGSHQIGSTFDESPGPLHPTPVAPGLFTAFDNRFIGTERALGNVFGRADWRVVPLQSAAPLMPFIRWVKWGTMIFTLAFISLIVLVIGFFFAAHIRKSMHLIRQGIELEIRVEERTAELAAANAEITALNEQLKAENLRMGAELEVTRQLQQMILPTPEELGAVSGLDIAGYMAPADEVGGDYYGVLEQNGQVKIGIGDVTGHGLESGMVMRMTQMAVRPLLNSGETDLVRFLDILNRTLFDNVQRMGTDKHLTLSLLDYVNGEVRLSGQHEELVVARREGSVDLVDTIDLGFPIG
jgi:hypothetical protein